MYYFVLIILPLIGFTDQRILSGAKTMGEGASESSAPAASAPREEVNIEDIADDIPF